MVGGYPSQVRMVGGTLARSGWWGVPCLGLDGGGYPRQVRKVGGTWHTPHLDWMGYPPPTSIASTCYEVLCYTSCVHAGGLSCLTSALENGANKMSVSTISQEQSTQLKTVAINRVFPNRPI